MENNGLFGLDPAMVQALVQKEQEASRDKFVGGLGQTGVGASLFNPIARGAYGLLQQTKETLNPDPRVKKAKDLEEMQEIVSKKTQPGTPEFYKLLAQEAQTRGYPEIAERAAVKLREIESKGIEKQGKLLQQEKTALEIETAYKKLTNRDTATVESDGQQKLIDKQTGEVISVIGAAPDRRTKITVNGASSSLEDLKRAIDIKDKILGDVPERREEIQRIKTSLQTLAGNEFKDPNGVALNSLRTQLAKMVGDSVVGQREAKEVLGSLGFVGDMTSFVSEFVSGIPSQEKMLKVAEFVSAFKSNLDKSYEVRGKAYNDLIDTTKDITEESKGAVKVKLSGESNVDSVVVGGKSYTKPQGMTDQQWQQYKQDQGVK